MHQRKLKLREVNLRGLQQPVLHEAGNGNPIVVGLVFAGDLLRGNDRRNRARIGDRGATLEPGVQVETARDDGDVGGIEQTTGNRPQGGVVMERDLVQAPFRRQVNLVTAQERGLEFRRLAAGFFACGHLDGDGVILGERVVFLHFCTFERGLRQLVILWLIEKREIKLVLEANFEGDSQSQ